MAHFPGKIDSSLFAENMMNCTFHLQKNIQVNACDEQLKPYFSFSFPLIVELDIETLLYMYIFLLLLLFC